MCARMITRGDILWLGIASGVTGGIIGGPSSAIIGWLLSRRLAKRLTTPQ